MRAKIRACAPDAIDFLLSVVRGEVKDAKPSDRIRAAEVIVNKTIAPPKQSIRVSGRLGNPIGDLSTEDIQALIRAAKGEGK